MCRWIHYEFNLSLSLSHTHTHTHTLAAVYSSISETTDPTRMLEEGYYAAPKSMEKVSD